jgi:hypothetical protein
MKQRQLLPIVTVTVTALARFGQKAKIGAMITTNTTMRSEKVFMTSTPHCAITNDR